MKIITLVLITMFFTCFALNANAFGKYKPRATSVEEINLLPDFCKHKNELFKTSEGVSKGEATFKESWVHMHHYCDALNSFNHAKKTRDKIEKKDWLLSADGHLNYMLKRTDENYFYLPQFLYDKAKVKDMQGEQNQAISLYMKAITLKKDFVPAYKALSRLYKKMGNKEMAIQTIEDGLKYAPNSKSLKKKLDRLTKK